MVRAELRGATAARDPGGIALMLQVHGIWLPDARPDYKVTVDPKDIKQDGTFCSDWFHQCLKHCHERDVAIDVGAHVGTWTRLMAKHFTFVHAFEPWPSHIECFERNIDATNVELHRKAVGDYVGKAYLQTGPKTPVRIGKAGLEVEITKLDDEGIDPVSFIKINCEGYDLAVLHGAREIIIRDHPVVFVEQHHIYRPEDYGYGATEAIDFLEGFGAKLMWQKGPHYCLAWS